jgi:hypothetical protein
MAEVFGSEGARVEVDGRGNHFLSSNRFLLLATSEEVYRAAIDTVRTLSGILNLLGGYVGNVYPASAEWIDSTGRRGGIAARATMIANVSNRAEVATWESRAKCEGQSFGQVFQRLCETNATARRVFQTISNEALTWVTIYLLIELLEESAGSRRALAKIARCKEAELSLVRRSANAHRHASTANSRAFRQMSLHAAAELARRVGKRWLETQVFSTPVPERMKAETGSEGRAALREH